MVKHQKRKKKKVAGKKKKLWMKVREKKTLAVKERIKVE